MEQSISSGSLSSSKKVVKKKSSALKEARNWIIYIVAVIAITMMMPKILAFALQTPYPMATITSQSMWPEMSRGDLVFMKGASGKEIKKGQVVVFKTQGVLVIHRVIEVNKDTIVTKGDANMTEDNPVKKSAVLGSAVTVGGSTVKIPYIGNFVMGLRGR